ncbi:MAG: tRNA lysidine(34) synthetase TilS [Gammaproteobacteria bacterium]|nr:tRNA lysidine(34) synthetase TilS [Gammaproteobacteria bacterium]
MSIISLIRTRIIGQRQPLTSVRRSGSTIGWCRLTVEAAARAARYAAFEAVLGPGDLLILGHHADDQVETVVMNMLRGSERPGLQGMPSDRVVGQASLVRPFLKVERARLIAYAESHGLEWIEDPSNARVQHDRNFLRHDVLPTLDQRFLGWRRRIKTALARDESFGQAVDEAVSRDLEVCLDGLGLRVDRLIKHSHARQRMILRRFLGERCPQQPSGRAIDEFLDQLQSSKARGRAELLVGDWTLDSDRGWIFLVSQKDAPLWLPEQWQGERFRRSGRLLLCQHSVRGGLQKPISQYRMSAMHLGLKIQRGHHQDVRELLRAAGIPRWLRERLPVVMEGESVVMVPAVLPWLEYPLVGDIGASSPSDAGWGLSLMMTGPPS